MTTTTRSELASEQPAWAERLRRLVFVRHAPVTALLLLVAVCLTCLGFVLRDFAALASVVPLVTMIAAFGWQARAR